MSIIERCAQAMTPHDRKLRNNHALAHYTGLALEANGCLIEAVQFTAHGARIRLHREPVEALRIRGYEVRRRDGDQIRSVMCGTYNGCRVEWPAP